MTETIRFRGRIIEDGAEYWDRLTIDPNYARSVIEESDSRRGDARFVEAWRDSGFPGWRESLGERWRARLAEFDGSS